MSFALGVVPIILLLADFHFVVLLASVSVALVFFMNVPLALHQNLFGAVDASRFLAIPFFIYAGELMGRGGVAERLVDFVQAGVGWVAAVWVSPPSGPRPSSGAISGNPILYRSHDRQGDAAGHAARRLSRSSPPASSRP
jgi:C4-dicarboxylate transporter DctM subunit